VLLAGALAACNRSEPLPPKAGPAANASIGPKVPAAAAGASETDRRFVEQATSAGMAAEEITRHAMSTAASADVKKLAQRLHADRLRVNQELARIATAKGMTLPPAPADDKGAGVEKLHAPNSDERDRAVLDKLAESHRESIDLFERAARQGADPALKAFADKTLATLREHLRMIESAVATAARPGTQTAATQ
jgi:putative membrane protein